MEQIIEPMPGTALIRLAASEYGDIPVPEKAHDSQTWGTVVAVNDSDKKEHGHLVGRIAYWRKYNDDARVVGTPEKLVFIEIRNILGTSYKKEK